MTLRYRLAETDAELEAARALRLEVFVQEQGVPVEEELDSLDATAVHVVAVDGDRVVGTGRLLKLSSTRGQIGRMAVSRGLRRQGIGSGVLARLEEEARSLGLRNITLHAQTYVQSFYRRAGYREKGKPFDEVGIEHVRMDKRLR